MEIKVKVTGAGTEKLFEIAIETELLEKSILCQKKWWMKAESQQLDKRLIPRKMIRE